jgi:hypothetical protein
MWRNIQNIIHFGFAHNNKNTEPGSLAMFCPAWPQPGINLPEDWEEDGEQSVPTVFAGLHLKAELFIRWKFTRGFVFDGSFSAEQLKMRRPKDDVHLTNGTGFLTQEERYQNHLKVAIEIKEVMD